MTPYDDFFPVSVATIFAIIPGNRAGGGISYPQRGQRTF
jgi:hypothetical protein